METYLLKKVIILILCLVLIRPLEAQESNVVPSISQSTQSPQKRRINRLPGIPVNAPSQHGVALQKNYKGHSYRFMPNPKTWHEAEKDAESLGGYLVVITNKEEDDFVLQLIQDANNGETPHVWIGLTDEANEGELKWVNGDKTVYWRNSPNKFLPSDVGDEDFVHYYAAPLGAQQVDWNDNIGSQEFAYVIECDQERPEIVRTVKDEKTISVKPLDGVLYYGFEDDKSFVYAAFLKKELNNNKFEVTWTLPFYDQKYRGSQPFELIKNDTRNIVMIRGNPGEWVYEAEIDSNGNLVNGKRYVLKNGEKDRQDAVWNLYKVK
jgi:hypothetical protein